MRLLLAGIGLAVLTATVAAQSPASATQTRPTFEVASIRLNTSGSPRGGADAAPSGRVFISNTSLYDLIRQGFELQRHEMVSGDRLPPWVESEKWDIVAQGPPITDQTSQRQLRVMLQSLLVDRFKLVTPMNVFVIESAERPTQE